MSSIPPVQNQQEEYLKALSAKQVDLRHPKPCQPAVFRVMSSQFTVSTTHCLLFYVILFHLFGKLPLQVSFPDMFHA